MTSSERKIINCLLETNGKTHIRMVAKKANLSSDYARLLCRSLARSGHIKFENDLVHLLKKGRSRFENNDLMTNKSMAVAANVTLFTDDHTIASQVNDQSDKEDNQEEGASEDKDKDKPVSSDEELDKSLPDLEPSPKREESEKLDELEEPEKNESTEETEGKEEQREEIAEDPKEEINMYNKEDTFNKDVLAETEATEEGKKEKPDEAELKPEPKAEEKGIVFEAKMEIATDRLLLQGRKKAENLARVAFLFLGETECKNWYSSNGLI